MIEVIYKEEQQEAQGSENPVNIPRNIRQIGQSQEDCRIYMEDYVYTFLVRLSRSEGEKDGQKGQAAVLTGETKWWSGVTYLFIRGAVLAGDMEAAADHIDFTEEIWSRIHEEQEKYFEEQEIVGWFFSQPQLPVEMTELFAKVHLRHFGGDKVLMLMEPQEKEEAFFRYENNAMVRQGGYYLYYEKNPQMQSYMIENNEELQIGTAEKYEDDAVKTFRKIITNKKKDTEQKAEEQTSVFSYAVTACLAIAVVAVGVNFYQNYRGVGETEQEAAQVSALIVEDTAAAPEGIREEKTHKSTPVPVISSAPKITGKPLKKEEPVSVKTALPAETPPEPLPEPTVNPNEKAEETSAVYREEADIRKAKRREASHESYVIKPGDTIFQISMDRYGTMDAMQEICRLNDLSIEEIIYPGQVIVLP